MTFTLTQTSAVVLETRGVSDGDTQLWLYGPNASTAQVVYDNDSENGELARCEWSIGSWNVLYEGERDWRQRRGLAIHHQCDCSSACRRVSDARRIQFD